MYVDVHYTHIYPFSQKRSRPPFSSLPSRNFLYVRTYTSHTQQIKGWGARPRQNRSRPPVSSLPSRKFLGERTYTLHTQQKRMGRPPPSKKIAPPSLLSLLGNSCVNVHIHYTRNKKRWRRLPLQKRSQSVGLSHHNVVDSQIIIYAIFSRAILVSQIIKYWILESYDLGFSSFVIFGFPECKI